jgi:uncharacterized protein
VRLSKYKKEFITTFWKENFPNSKVYLFGSRTNDAQEGGDIDLLILNDIEIDYTYKFRFLEAFWEEFGEQRVDVSIFTFADETTPFKFIALHTAIEL